MKITGTALETISAGMMVDGETNERGHFFVRAARDAPCVDFAPPLPAEKLAGLWRNLKEEIARVAARADRRPFEEIADAVMARQLFNEAVFECFPAILAALTQSSGDVLASCSREAPIGESFFITEAERDGGEPGFTISDLANAVQLWSFTQGPRVSLAQAARVFNAPPAMIARAVRGHHWMLLETAAGGLLDDATAIDDFSAVFIGHEGE